MKNWYNEMDIAVRHYTLSRINKKDTFFNPFIIYSHFTRNLRLYYGYHEFVDYPTRRNGLEY